MSFFLYLIIVVQISQTAVTQNKQFNIGCVVLSGAVALAVWQWLVWFKVPAFTRTQERKQQVAR